MARGTLTSRAAAALWSALIATVFAAAGAAWLCWWPITAPLELAFAVYLSSRVRALQRGKAHVPSSLRVRIAQQQRRARAPQRSIVQATTALRARAQRQLAVHAAAVAARRKRATPTATCNDDNCTSGAASADTVVVAQCIAGAHDGTRARRELDARARRHRSITRRG
jgi:hypothetical protein